MQPTDVQAIEQVLEEQERAMVAGDIQALGRARRAIHSHPRHWVRTAQSGMAEPDPVWLCLGITVLRPRAAPSP